VRVSVDLRCNARLPNLAELQDKACAINRRMLKAERAGRGTVSWFDFRVGPATVF